MQAPSGQITFNDRTPSAQLVDYVNTHIHGWLHEHHLDESVATEYEVAFFNEDTIDEISCLVIIQSGSHLWRSWETAENAKIALDRTLENLDESLKSESDMRH